MQLRSAPILVTLALAISTTATPTPDLAKRAVAGIAWEFSDRTGDASQLITVSGCVNILQPFDNWSAIEMSGGAYECFFWKNQMCGSVEDAMSLRDGDFWDIPSSPWADFDNAITSYQCAPVSDQAGIAYEGAFKGDTIPLYTANGACVNHKYINEFTDLTAVTVDSPYTCTFYKDIDCAGENAIVNSAIIGSVDFSNPIVPAYEGFNDLISSYKCSSL